MTLGCLTLLSVIYCSIACASRIQLRKNQDYQQEAKNIGFKGVMDFIHGKKISAGFSEHFLPFH